MKTPYTTIAGSRKAAMVARLRWITRILPLVMGRGEGGVA
jgi:hypothetical protein